MDVQLARLLQSDDFLGAFRRSAFYTELLRVLGDDQLQSELYLQTAASAAEQPGLEFDPNSTLTEVGDTLMGIGEEELLGDQVDGRLPGSLVQEGGPTRLPSELVRVRYINT